MMSFLPLSVIRSLVEGGGRRWRRRKEEGGGRRKEDEGGGRWSVFFPPICR